MDTTINIDKSTKRIAKLVNKGFQGYPEISFAYYGQTTDLATQVVVSFILDQGVAPQEEQLSCKTDAKKDETIQTTLVKIIERAGAKTVTEVAGVALIK